jgi:hypothetical protein
MMHIPDPNETGLSPLQKYLREDTQSFVLAVGVMMNLGMLGFVSAIVWAKWGAISSWFMRFFQ